MARFHPRTWFEHVTAAGQTQGDRIRALFSRAQGEVAIIAPFIKVGALISLLEVVPPDTHLRCVTRWFPREVAAGVSDPEILDLLEERGRFTFTLVDSLHAKLYIAGNDCLAGSSNVTLPGLGESSDGNIEVLVATTIQDPGVASTLGDIAEAERPATRTMAEATRRLADNLVQPEAEPEGEKPWFPHSRRPERAFRLYSRPPTGYLGEADRILLSDVAGSNLPPGLEKEGFLAELRALLAKIPLAKALLDATEDVTLTRADAHSHLEMLVTGDFSTNDLWLAFVNWMGYFFPDQVMKDQIAEVALRRAQLLN